MNDGANITITATGGATGGIVATNAETVAQFFWQTPEWNGAVAIGGVLLLVISIINGASYMYKNFKGRHKDD